jgi:uncharacterized protein YkwD
VLRVAILVVAALLPASLVVQPAVSAASPATRFANSAFKATNAKRTDAGLRPLARNACLQKFANSQARKMATRGAIFHQQLGPIQNECNVGYVGENVAYGYPTGPQVVAGWMASPGHRSNILSTHYTLMAIGAAKNGSTWYVAQVFGRPM